MSNWDLNKMYENSEQIERDVDKVRDNLKELILLKKDPENNLCPIFKNIEKIYRRTSKLSSYAGMKKDEDSRISENQKLDLKIDSLWTEISEETAFLDPFLYSIEHEKMNRILSDKDMSDYKNYIERKLRYKDHTLSKEKEEILASMGELSQLTYNDFYNLSYADMTFPEMETTDIPLNQANYSKLMTNKDRKVREEAFRKMYTVYGNYKHTFGSALYGNIKFNQTIARIKKYSSAREMALFSDEVSTEVYDGLIQSIYNHLPSFQRYYKIRAKRLNIQDPSMIDVYAPIIEYKEEISFEQAKEMILEALKPMGEEYIKIVEEAFDENWIDVYPREGKRAGAYSGGCYDSDPYILMNYTGTLDSVFTLMHELGHSVHSYLSRKNNVYFNSSYRIFVAEVASTFNELLLLHYLKENSKDDERRLYLLDYHLNSFKSTVFRQTMFGEFERDIYNIVESGEGLTGEDFSNIYYDLNQKYFGNSLNINREISLEWERVPHFYYGFYVYKYATGFCAATILSEKLLHKEDGILEKYLDFLRDGGKNPPLDQLKKAGCNIEDPEVLEIALSLFDRLVDEYEK